MTVYVDDLFTMEPRTNQAKRYGTRWCHMFTDSLDLEELHQMAGKLGLRRYFQVHPTLPHYDLIPSKRTLAINLGAKPVTPEENKAILVESAKRRRAAKEETAS